MADARQFIAGQLQEQEPGAGGGWTQAPDSRQPAVQMAPPQDRVTPSRLLTRQLTRPTAPLYQDAIRQAYYNPNRLDVSELLKMEQAATELRISRLQAQSWGRGAIDDAEIERLSKDPAYGPWVDRDYNNLTFLQRDYDFLSRIKDTVQRKLDLFERGEDHSGVIDEVVEGWDAGNLQIVYSDLGQRYFRALESGADEQELEALRSQIGTLSKALRLMDDKTIFGMFQTLGQVPRMITRDIPEIGYYAGHGAIAGGMYGSVAPGVGTLAGTVAGATAGAAAGVFSASRKMEEGAFMADLALEKDDAGKYLDLREVLPWVRGYGVAAGIVEVAGDYVTGKALNLLPLRGLLSGLGRRGAMTAVRKSIASKSLTKPTVDLLKALGESGLGQAGEEGVQELFQTVAETALKRSLGDEGSAYWVNKPEYFTKEDLSQIGDAAMSGFQMGFWFGILPGSIKAVARTRAAYKAREFAQANKEIAHDLATTATKESPAATISFLQTLGMDGSVRVSVPVDAVAELDREKGLGIAKALHWDEKDVAEAAQNGREVTIPLCTLHALLNEGQMTAVADVMRQAPMAMNAQEAAVVNENLPADLDREIQNIKAGAEEIKAVKVQTDRLTQEIRAAANESPHLMAQFKAVNPNASAGMLVRTVLGRAVRFAVRLASNSNGGLTVSKALELLKFDNGQLQMGAAGQAALGQPTERRLVDNADIDAVRTEWTNEDGTMREGYHLAPNGAKSTLSERRWAAVRSKKFKDRYGDWEADPDGSDVILDENGEPVAVLEHLSQDRKERVSLSDAMKKTLDDPSLAGPRENDPVALPPPLYQVQNVDDWIKRLTAWKKNALSKDLTPKQRAAEEKAIDRWAKSVTGAHGKLQEYLDRRDGGIFQALSTAVIGARQAVKKAKSGGVTYSGPVRSNIDSIYLISFDASSMCVKRLSAANTARLLEQRLGRPLNVDDQMLLIALYQEKGKAAPCLYCYVESNRRRANQAVGEGLEVVFGEKSVPASWGKDRKEAAQEAIEEAQRLGVKKEDIHFEYLTDPKESLTDEAANERRKYKKIYDYLTFEAAATKQNKQKPYEEYEGQLLDLKPEDVELLNGYAGIRFFSTSDFQIEHVVDLIQAFYDMNAMGAKSHSYTKVPLFVDIFGGTGQKINQSCFAKGVDKHGSTDPAKWTIIQDDAQGWNHAAAKANRKKYKDVGICLVASSDDILLAALHDPEIDYIIPFHYSGLERKYYGALGYQDFTSTQNESLIYKSDTPRRVSPSEVEAMKKLPVEEASRQYLQKCFSMQSYPIKLDQVFADIAGDKSLSESKKQILGKARWEEVVAAGELDPSTLNPTYFTERLKAGASTHDKAMFSETVAKVRMHEMGTVGGVSDEQGTRNYLQLCLERKIYPVFPAFMFKGFRPADVTQDTLWLEYDQAVREKRPETDKKTWEQKRTERASKLRKDATDVAKKRWKEMVDAGKIDWDQIEPNFFKLKKDYARTDTSFDVVDPDKINHAAAVTPLRETLEKGLDTVYAADTEIADEMESILKEVEGTDINYGVKALEAIRAKTGVAASIFGKDGGRKKGMGIGKMSEVVPLDRALGPENAQQVTRPAANTLNQVQIKSVDRGDARIFYQGSDNIPTNGDGVRVDRVTECRGWLSVQEAKAALAQLDGEKLPNLIEEIVAEINHRQRGKLASKEAAQKSIDNGFRRRQHNTVASEIQNAWKWAAEAWSGPGYKPGDSPDTRYYRFVSALNINGEDAFAWISCKESSFGMRLYSFELVNKKELWAKLEGLANPPSVQSSSEEGGEGSDRVPTEAGATVRRRTFEEIIDRLNGPVNGEVGQASQAAAPGQGTLFQTQASPEAQELDRQYFDAIARGDTETVQRMVREAAERAGFGDTIPEQSESYLLRTKPAPRKTKTVYKIFYVDVSAGLPTTLFVGGVEHIPLGVWLDAAEPGFKFQAPNGKWYVPTTVNPNRKSGQTTGSEIVIPNDEVRRELIRRKFLPKGSKRKKITAVAYRPGWHAGVFPHFPQGGTKVDGVMNHEYNQVIYECEVCADTDYTEKARMQPKARTKKGGVDERAADFQEMVDDGFYYYTTNPALAPKEKAWVISNSIKINRALTQEECDRILRENGQKVQPLEQGKMDLASLGITDPEMSDAYRKTLAPITYDENGKVIPLSQRFNPDNPSVLYQGGRQNEGQSVTGGITALDDGTYAISVCRGANLSTMLHELSHYYFLMAQRLAAQGMASDQLLADIKTLEDWTAKLDDDEALREEYNLYQSGIYGGRAFEDLTPEEKAAVRERGKQEMLARGFEAYLREGKAPSSKLRDVFARIKEWMLKVYRNARDLHVELTDEVRDVFDRIMENEEDMDLKAEAMQIRDETETVLDELGVEGPDRMEMATKIAVAKSKAADKNRLLRDRHRRELMRQWGHDAAEQARSEKIQKVREAVRKAKVDLASVKDAVGNQAAAQLMKRLPGACVNEGGVDIRELAEENGYASVEDMVRELTTAPTLAQRIKEIVRQKQADHDVETDSLDALYEQQELGEQQQKIGELLEKKIKKVTAEARYRNEVAGRTVGGEPVEVPEATIKKYGGNEGLARWKIGMDQLRARAREALDKLTLGEATNPAAFRQSAAQWMQKERQAILRKDYLKAIEYNYKARINVELARQSAERRDLMDKLQDAVRQRLNMDKASVNGRYAIYRVAMAIQLVTPSRKAVNNASDKTMDDVNEFLDELAGAGYLSPGDIPAEAFNLLGPWRKLTWTDAKTHIQALAQLLHGERELRTARTKQGREDLEAFATRIADSILAHKKKIDRGLFTKMKGWEKNLRKIHAAHLTADTIVLLLDGDVIGGPAWNAIIRPINDATWDRADRLAKAKDALEKLFLGTYTRQELSEMQRTRFMVDGVPDAFTKEQAICVLLNWGNQSNRDRLMAGLGLNEEQVQAIIDTLDRRDVEFCQAVWDYLESFREESFDLEESMTGVRPEKIVAMEVQTRHGVLRGGYYPAIYDPELTSRTSPADEPQVGKQTRAMFPVVDHGSMKQRSGKIGLGSPLRLSLRVVPEHVVQTCHMLAMRRAVAEVAKLLRRPEINSAIQDTAGVEIARALDDWLKYVAGERPQGDPFFAKVAGWVRMRAAFAAMALKLTTMLAQTMGILYTIPEIGLKWTLVGVADMFAGGNIDGVQTMGMGPLQAYNTVCSLSSFMRHRVNALDREIFESSSDLIDLGAKNKYVDPFLRMQRFIQQKGFLPMAYVQLYFSDLPTWLGAYKKRLSETHDMDEAVHYADATVTRTQGGGAEKDLAAVQRGRELGKLMTMYYTVFGALYNLSARRVTMLNRNRDIASVFRLGTLMLSAWFAEAVITGALQGKGPDKDDPDMEDWMLWAAKEAFFNPFQMVVGVRDVANVIDSKMEGIDRQFSFGSGLSIMDVVIRALYETGQAAFGETKEGHGKKTATDVIKATGQVTGLIPTQAVLVLQAFWDWLDGTTPEFEAWKILRRHR